MADPQSKPRDSRPAPTLEDIYRMVAGRHGWGYRDTVVRVSIIGKMDSTIEYIACAYAASDSDQNKARVCRTGIGLTEADALSDLRYSIETAKED